MNDMLTALQPNYNSVYEYMSNNHIHTTINNACIAPQEPTPLTQGAMQTVYMFLQQ